MKRTGKFCLAAVLALSLTALFAGSAAASLKFISPEGKPASIDGEAIGKHITPNASGTNSCDGPSFTGVLPTQVGTFIASYPLTQFGPCDYSLDQPETSGDCQLGFFPGSGTVSVGNSSECVLAQWQDYCIVKLLPSEALDATYTNEGTGSSAVVRVTVDTNKLNYSLTGPCSFSGTGQYKGSWILRALDGSGGQMGLRVAETTSLAIDGDEFSGEFEPMNVGGSVTATNTFTLNGLKTTCGSGSFAGSLAEMGSELSLVPSYGTCKWEGMLNAVVDMNGCDYLFEVDEAGSPATGSANIACGEGEGPMEFDVKFLGSVLCTIAIPAQSLGAATFENAGEGWAEHVVAKVSGSGIEFSEDSGECGGSGSDGSFAGTIDLIGTP